MSIQEELARDYRDAKRTRSTDRLEEHWNQLLAEKKVKPRDFSMSLLFEETVESGREILDQWRRNPGDRMSLQEAGVTTAAFSRINKQLISTEVMAAYEAAAWIGAALTTTKPASSLYGMREPGLANLGDQVEAVGEGKPYPYAGFGEDFVQVPDLTKRGLIVAVTKEALAMDLTGQVLDRAAQVGDSLGENKESRILNVVAGITSTYNRKNRGVVATYGDNSGSHDWDNLAASNALADWTDVDAARLLFDSMPDPNTGIPLANMGGTEILVPSGLSTTADRIINATEVEHVDNQANAATIRTRSRNPLTGYSAMSTSRLSSVQGNQTTWYVGAFRKAFTYYEWWPITTSQQGAGSEAEFTRDIVAQYKASECGVAAASEPRHVVKCTA